MKAIKSAVIYYYLYKFRKTFFIVFLLIVSDIFMGFFISDLYYYKNGVDLYVINFIIYCEYFMKSILRFLKSISTFAIYIIVLMYIKDYHIILLPYFVIGTFYFTNKILNWANRVLESRWFNFSKLPTWWIILFNYFSFCCDLFFKKRCFWHNLLFDNI